MQTVFADNIVIYADSREVNSKIASILGKMCVVREKQLDVADYLLSSRCAAERKTTADFLQSMINQRLFGQLNALKQFECPVLIIEGDTLFDGERKIHPNAIRGCLASIATDFSVPILWTKSQVETADLLFAIARREQMESKKCVAIRGKKKARSFNELQEFLIAGLPGISTATAKKLLKHFGTPERIFSAGEAELQQVDGIGKELSKRIRNLMAKKYEKSILED